MRASSAVTRTPRRRHLMGTDEALQLAQRHHHRAVWRDLPRCRPWPASGGAQRSEICRSRKGCSMPDARTAPAPCGKRVEASRAAKALDPWRLPGRPGAPQPVHPPLWNRLQQQPCILEVASPQSAVPAGKLIGGVGLHGVVGNVPPRRGGGTGPASDCPGRRCTLRRLRSIRWMQQGGRAGSGFEGYVHWIRL